MVKKDKKTFYLSLVAVLVLLVILGAATYAFFRRSGIQFITDDVVVTSNTTDLLTFQISNNIGFTINQADFGTDGYNRSSHAIATATLTPNNKTGAATEHYYLYLQLTENPFVYSEANINEDPELLLQLFDGNDQLVAISGLGNQVTINQLTGYDITTATGLIPLLDYHEITASNNTPTVESWKVVISLINLPLNQNDNIGKTIEGIVFMMKDEYTICNDLNNDLSCNLQLGSRDASFSLETEVVYNNGSHMGYICDHYSCDFDYDYDPNAQGYIDDGITRLSNNEQKEITAEPMANYPMCTRINEASPEDWDKETGTGVNVYIGEAGADRPDCDNTFIINGTSRAIKEDQHTCVLTVWDENTCYVTIGGTTDEGSYATQKYIVYPSDHFVEGSLTMNYRYEYGSKDTDDGSFRYAGADPNNYVCFGSDETPCPADNLYRLLGVISVEEVIDPVEEETETKLLYKLIKNDYLNETQMNATGSQWGGIKVSSDYYYGPAGNYADYTVYGFKPYSFSDSDRSSYDNRWNSDSAIYTGLNTSFYNTFSEYWQNLIANVAWTNNSTYLRDITHKASPVAVYNHEILYPTGYESTTYAKIGTLYAYEYAFAVKQSHWGTPLVNYDNLSRYNWLYRGVQEWILTQRLNDYDSSYMNTSFVINEYAKVDAYYSNQNAAIRPTFYLIDNVRIDKLANKGTKNDPFRIVLIDEDSAEDSTEDSSE